MSTIVNGRSIHRINKLKQVKATGQHRHLVISLPVIHNVTKTSELMFNFVHVFSRKELNSETQKRIYAMRQTNTRVISEPQESYVFYYSHFEITGDSCNLVGSQQGDLFPNRTFFLL